jgi:phage repressor protein C with HTH and peptisase S24 domain
MSTQGDRLRQGIRLAGFTRVSDFAEAIGEKAVTVRAHIQRESIPVGAVEKYVRKLAPIGVTTEWLLFNKGPAPKGVKALPPPRLLHDPRPAGASIEITHVVGAGDEVYPVPGDSPLGHVPAPPGYEHGGAAAIKGDSMLPAYHDRDLLFYKEWESPPKGLRQPDRPVLIELRDGRSFLKKILSSGRDGRYHLLSINPAAPIIKDVVVTRIARIGWVWVEGSPGD